MQTIGDHSALDEFLTARCLRVRGPSCPVARLWRAYREHQPGSDMTRDLFLAALVASGIRLARNIHGQTMASGVALVEVEPV